MQVKPLAGVGMRRGKILVQCDPKTRRIWRRDVAVIHLERAADQVRVEWCLDGFAHQQVRDRSRQMDISGPLNRPCVKVRREFRVEHFRQSGKLLRLPDTAHATQRGLQYLQAASAQQRCEFGLRGQPFTRRNRDAHGFCHLRKFKRVVGRQRLLEPKRRIGLYRVPQPDRAGGVELPMCAKQQIRAVAHGGADGFAKRNGQGNVEHGGLMACVDRIGAGGVKLHRCVAAIDGVQRRFRGHIRRGPEFC